MSNKFSRGAAPLAKVFFGVKDGSHKAFNDNHKTVVKMVRAQCCGKNSKKTWKKQMKK